MTPGKELAAAVQRREHWQFDGAAALYAPPHVASAVRVVPIVAGTHRKRVRAIIVRDGRAQHSRPAGSAVAAVRWAEQIPLG